MGNLVLLVLANAHQEIIVTTEHASLKTQEEVTVKSGENQSAHQAIAALVLTTKEGISVFPRTLHIPIVPLIVTLLVAAAAVRSARQARQLTKDVESSMPATMMRGELPPAIAPGLDTPTTASAPRNVSALPLREEEVVAAAGKPALLEEGLGHIQITALKCFPVSVALTTSMVMLVPPQTACAAAPRWGSEYTALIPSLANAPR
ncbi:hypothetical protein KC640_01565 [Candidatus Dojkabacteria bacterium]|uniref:Uncharacterized protein n=1 Tax=Candidatus Dojkabacteria bacterium TaxID=2099670 RepID=A0A955I729_9BACT|nr:hypothetical protein [Candidatus Dojkabacteria bacterium]